MKKVIIRQFNALYNVKAHNLVESKHFWLPQKHLPKPCITSDLTQK